MNCIYCGSTALTERSELTAHGYRRLRCRDCERQFNEHLTGVLNRTCLPSDIIAFVVFCRLCYRLTLRDLSESCCSAASRSATRLSAIGRAKLLPIMADALRKRRHGELRDLLRSRRRHRQIVPAALRRFRFVKGVGIALDIMQTA